MLAALFLCFAGARLCAQAASGAAPNAVAAFGESAASGSENASPSAAAPAAPSGTSSLREAEEQMYLNLDGNQGGTLGSPAPTTSTGWLFVRMILVLVVVIALIYAVVWLLKRSMQPGADEDPYLKKTASLTLAPGRTVQVVTLGDQAFLLGVSENAITLLSEVTDKELVDAMNVNAPAANSKKPLDFASMLASFSGSSKSTEDYIRKRRESMQRGRNQ